MITKDFFSKYESYLADSSNDSRGVFGSMDKNTSIPYREFRDNVINSPDLNILVYYYHPEKPYFWGEPGKFPFTEAYGPGPNDEPYIIKRSIDWYCVPEAARKLKAMCFTVLKWEFEVTTIFFDYNFNNIETGILFTKNEINEHLNKEAMGL